MSSYKKPKTTKELISLKSTQERIIVILLNEARRIAHKSISVTKSEKQEPVI